MAKGKQKSSAEKPKSGMVNINLRAVPKELRAFLKKTAHQRGMTLDSFCTQQLARVTSDANGAVFVQTPSGPGAHDDLKLAAAMATGLSGVPQNPAPFHASPSAKTPYDPNEAASAAVILGEENPPLTGLTGLRERNPGAEPIVLWRDGQPIAEAVKSEENQTFVDILPIPATKEVIDAAIEAAKHGGTIHIAGGKGPHLLRDRKGNTAYCGGPGLCEFCDEGVPPSGDHHAELVENIVLEHYSAAPVEGFEGESREEFERDRMGQTGEDNARKMKERSAAIAAALPENQTCRCGHVHPGKYKNGVYFYSPCNFRDKSGPCLCRTHRKREQA